MKALVKNEPRPGVAELVDREPRALESHEVLVKVEAAAICGSDIHIYDWTDWAAGYGISLPQIMGHEFSGRVEDVGPAVTMVNVGDRVAGETHIPCGHCPQCRSGAQHMCHNLRIFGVKTDGCFADYTVLPEACAVKLLDGISPEEATMLEPMGGPFRAMSALQVGGQTVLVLGCGPIGLFGIAWAKILGAARVIATDVSDFRLELGRRMGADFVLNPAKEDLGDLVGDLTGGIGVDSFADFSGSTVAIKQGLKTVRRAGKAVLFGIPSGDMPLNVASEVVLKELTLFGLNGRAMYDTWQRTQAMLAAKKIDVSPVITHRMPLAYYAEGFALASAGQAGKVILYPSQGNA